MLWTKSFMPTLREAPQEAETTAHKLMLRSGLTRMLVAGVYSYLPLGLKVLNNIQRIVRQEMNAKGAQELLLPALQPQELWDATGRNSVMEEIMIRFVDRRGRKMCLGPTHEEIITHLAAGNINSYKQFPFILYQIQTKFRDEIRPRFGLIRGCEFIMKDAYSFDIDEEGLEKNYRLMYDAYLKIFARTGLNILITEADSGVMGGKVSHEFMVPASSGEDSVFVCPKCNYATTNRIEKCPRPEGRGLASNKPEGDGAASDSRSHSQSHKCALDVEEKKAIEIGHIFKLGTKYSQALSALFTDENGRRLPMIMGCYGIGVSRMVAAVIETNHDEDGIVWPKEISPFDVLILPLNISDPQTKDTAFKLYRELAALGVEALLDDRDERSGVKFKDADLIGIPLRIVLGPKNIKDNKLEIQRRKDKSVEVVGIDQAIEKIRKEIGK